MTYKRSSWTGKEKEVDGKIIAQATKTICRQENSIIAIVGGDRDFLPVVEIAESMFEETNNVMEIWSWEHSLSQSLAEANPEADFLTIRYLDAHMDTIGFAQEEYNLSVDHIPRDVSLVAVGMKLHELMQQFVESFVYPVYYLDHGDDKIIIPVYSSLTPEEFNQIFLEVKSYFQVLGDPNPIITYVEYLNRYSLESGSEISVSNSFGPLGESLIEEDRFERQEPVMTPSSEESPWLTCAKTEIRAKKKDAVIKGRRELCRYGYFCDKPRTCKYLHAEAHIALFDRGKKKSRKKCKECMEKPCRYSHCTDSCNFLHPGDIPMCLWCAEQHQPNCYDRHANRLGMKVS